MRNLNRAYFTSLVFAAFTFVSVDGFSQTKTPQETLAVFPESVSGIMKNSCVGCHSDQSNSKAKTFLNLSEWDKLNHKKQKKMGKQINNVVVNGTMPPEGFLKRRPEAALTLAQVENITAWSKSIKRNSKK